MIEAGYQDFARRWKPILNSFQKLGVKFALEVHPTEIAFDIASAERAIAAVDGHPAFGFNYDPSHLGYQGVDYVEFIYRFSERIFHVHMKDVGWSATPQKQGFRRPPQLRRSPSVLGFPLPGPRQHRLRGDHPRPQPHQLPGPSLGRVGGQRHGPRARCDRACAFVKEVDFKPSAVAFDAAFGD